MITPWRTTSSTTAIATVVVVVVVAAAAAVQINIPYSSSCLGMVC